MAGLISFEFARIYNVNEISSPVYYEVMSTGRTGAPPCPLGSDGAQWGLGSPTPNISVISF